MDLNSDNGMISTEAHKHKTALKEGHVNTSPLQLIHVKAE